MGECYLVPPTLVWSEENGPICARPITEKDERACSMFRGAQ